MAKSTDTGRLCLMTRRSAASQVWISLAVCVAGLTSTGLADENDASYAGAIEAAPADLNAGKIAEAGKRLAATDESRRGFEFAYLKARAAASTEGEAAGDLIRKVAKPEVDTRYGVLNPVTRQLVFICRDGGIRIHDLKNGEQAHCCDRLRETAADF